MAIREITTDSNDEYRHISLNSSHTPEPADTVRNALKTACEANHRTILPPTRSKRSKSIRKMAPMYLHHENKRYHLGAVLLGKK